MNNNLLNCTLNFIVKMLLLKKIEIFEIPYEIRSTSKSFYITACRVYRNDNMSKYWDVLKLLSSDIDTTDDENKAILINLRESLISNMSFIEE